MFVTRPSFYLQYLEDNYCKPNRKNTKTEEKAGERRRKEKCGRVSFVLVVLLLFMSSFVRFVVDVIDGLVLEEVGPWCYC